MGAPGSAPSRAKISLGPSFVFSVASDTVLGVSVPSFDPVEAVLT